MSTITSDTQLRLINNLANLETVDSNDLTLIQRGLKSYKLSYANLVSGLPDNTTLQASSNTLGVKDSGITTSKIADDAVTYDKLQNVTGPVVLGKASGTGSVESLTIDTDLTSVSGSHNTIPSSLAVKNALTAAPFYRVTIAYGNNSFTQPSDFDALGLTKIEYKYLSYGALPEITSYIGFYGPWINSSALFEMNVNVINPTTVSMYCAGRRNQLHTYVDGSKTGITNATLASASLVDAIIQIPLTVGEKTIQFVWNDSGFGLQALSLLGDIIDLNVEFNG